MTPNVKEKTMKMRSFLGSIGLALCAVLFLGLPLLALAQAVGTAPGAGAPPLATYRGIDLTPIIGAVISGIGLALTWLIHKMQASRAAADAAAATTSSAQFALIRVGELGVLMLGRTWDALSPKMQVMLADGKITAEERAEIEAILRDLLDEFTSEDELEKLARALGLPLAGVIAKIASFVIEKFTAAHDPTIPTVSANAYPVSVVAIAGDAG